MEQVLAGVPKDKRCSCRADAVAQRAKTDPTDPTAAKTAAPPWWKSW